MNIKLFNKKSLSQHIEYRLVTFVGILRAGVRGLRVVVAVFQAVRPLEAGDGGGRGQLGGCVEDIKELLVNLIVG